MRGNDVDEAARGQMMGARATEGLEQRSDLHFKGLNCLLVSDSVQRQEQMPETTQELLHLSV